MSQFIMKRLGTIMEPEAENELEVEGILNPAAARGPNGDLYLFPRMVAKGNYSRIGIVKVKFDRSGDPVGKERLGIALEPEADYEKRTDGDGGCEDPRVTYVEPLQCYIMSYTAFSPGGPWIALARSKDLLKWERRGLATYAPYDEVEFNAINNKDACMFPRRSIRFTAIPRWRCFTGRCFPAPVPKNYVIKLIMRSRSQRMHLDVAQPYCQREA
jgi:predicted GH43/DUF377 family glycosyl hydrolase